MAIEKVIIILLWLFYQSIFSCKAQNVSINNTGSSPNLNAILDVNSTNKGILIPRVNLADTSHPIGGIKPLGLMVWNDNIDFDKGKGFYFWEGSKWHPVVMIYKSGNGIKIDSATNTINSIALVLNTVTQDGIVPAPTSANRRAKYQTDFKGNPAWKKEDKTSYYIEHF